MITPEFSMKTENSTAKEKKDDNLRHGVALAIPCELASCLSDSIRHCTPKRCKSADKTTIALLPLQSSYAITTLYQFQWSSELQVSLRVI